MARIAFSAADKKLVYLLIAAALMLLSTAAVQIVVDIVIRNQIY